MEVLKKISELKVELDQFRPLSKETEARVMQKFRLDWNYHSNHIEGNTLTYGETKALILFGITARGKPLKDHIEMTGHHEAIRWIESILHEERPITEKFIRDLHTLLLKESYESPIITPEGVRATKKVKVGKYKTVPNHVLTRTGEIYRFATPEETPAKMADLMEWFRDEKTQKDTHPLLIAAEFHYKFIRIHPFDDGNGRTARILMNFILMQAGYPPVIIKTEDRANYIAALQQADAGLIEPFIEYIGENLERSLGIMLKGARGESIEEPDDVDKEIALLKQKLKGEQTKLQILKTKELLLKFFDESLFDLIKSFIISCKKFDTFYNELKLTINGENEHMIPFMGKHEGIDINIIKEIRKDYFEQFKLTRLKIAYEYSTFNTKGYPPFNYSSTIELFFNEYSCSIKSHSIEVNKTYAEQLKRVEIEKLIRSETKAHMKFIEEQIEKSKNNQQDKK